MEVKQEWDEDPLGVEQDPENIVPDQYQEEEDDDISQESDDVSDGEVKLVKKPSRNATPWTDSDSGVDDPLPEGGPHQLLSPLAQRKKKEARRKREEKWVLEDDEDQNEEGKDEYKTLPKIEHSCGIREVYTLPDKNIIGPKLHAICSHILHKNILISPLNQEYTENSHGHKSLVLGAWRTQLEERYKMKSGF